jgi:nucleosome binding factor SPN SPT16 subunit
MKKYPADLKKGSLYVDQ